MTIDSFFKSNKPINCLAHCLNIWEDIIFLQYQQYFNDVKMSIVLNKELDKEIKITKDKVMWLRVTENTYQDLKDISEIEQCKIQSLLRAMLRTQITAYKNK